MKIAVSWSTGKDSAWMLHRLNRRHPGAVAALLSTTNEAFDRVAMHAVPRAVLEAQAEAAGLPVRIVPLPWPCSNEEYDRRMRLAVDALVADGFTHVAFGDLFLADVRAYRESRLAGTGLAPLFPLWKGQPTAALAREMVAAGLRAVVTCVDPRRLAPAFAGRVFDAQLLDDLPPDVDPCGEHGEFHTCVYAGPMFRAPLPITVGDTVERDGFVFADVSLAHRLPDGRDHRDALPPR
ncbi:MAG: ATP-binding protein [Acidobacteriota bacterium]